MKKPTLIQWHWIAVIGLLLCIMWLASGCYSTKKAQFQVGKAQVLRPAVVAKICADLYPPRVFDSTRIEYRQGETIYRHDTVSTTIDCPPNSTGTTRTVRIPCPPCPVQVDTLYTTKYSQVENTARVSQLTTELQKERDARIKAESGRGMWRIIALIFIVYTIVRLVLRMWFRISLP